MGWRRARRRRTRLNEACACESLVTADPDHAMRNGAAHSVIASEAKQSTFLHFGNMDCFASLAMTVQRPVTVPPASLAAAVDLAAHDRDRLLIDLGRIPGFDRR